MRFIELRKLCNARFYSLEICSNLIVERTDIDVDEDRYAKTEFVRIADAEVIRFQPYITDDGKPGLEVEVNI